MLSQSWVMDISEEYMDNSGIFFLACGVLASFIYLSYVNLSSVFLKIWEIKSKKALLAGQMFAVLKKKKRKEGGTLVIVISKYH